MNPEICQAPEVEVEIVKNHRKALKRRCVSLLRQLEASVPLLGDTTVFLKADRRAQDAVYTLTALHFSPELIATFVARDRFTEKVVIDILAAAVSRSLLNLLKEINNG